MQYELPARDGLPAPAVSTPDCPADPACTAEVMGEPAATESKPAQADTPGRVLANTEHDQAEFAPIKPGASEADQAKPEQVKPDHAERSPIVVKAHQVKVLRPAPKMLSARPRRSNPVTVPPLGLPVRFPGISAPLVAATPELVLSHRAPVLVADARPGGSEPAAENAELTSALRSSNAPSDSAAGSTTGLAAVGGLLVLGLVSTRLTAKGRKRRPAPRTAR